MANLSTMSGGGIKRITHYIVEGTTDSSSFNQSVPITEVDDVSKTSVVLNQTGKDHEGIHAIYLLNSTTVRYCIRGLTSYSRNLSFSVIEYN